MTKEEAKQWILEHMPPDDDTKQSQVMAVVIEALKQEPILDKIRAEINKALSAETISDNNQQISDVGIGLELALSIINKYKTESEK